MNLNQHKTIIDLVKLNELNAEGCPPPKYIHENEAIFDKKAGSYFERRCYASRKTD
jgi:hypothetical protein